MFFPLQDQGQFMSVMSISIKTISQFISPAFRCLLVLHLALSYEMFQQYVQRRYVFVPAIASSDQNQFGVTYVQDSDQENVKKKKLLVAHFIKISNINGLRHFSWYQYVDSSHSDCSAYQKLQTPLSAVLLRKTSYESPAFKVGECGGRFGPKALNHPLNQIGLFSCLCICTRYAEGNFGAIQILHGSNGFSTLYSQF